ncbi:zinc ABC transporter substrate-binding protein [Rhodospirillales bacterium]|nr:zinc ABC transporter substrate-binding protein [Rhodospirillales bacterium]
MKIVRGLAVSLLVFVAPFASAHGDTPVVVSIKPIHSLVAGVMEGVGSPSLIVKGAASPHTFSLTPSQAKNLYNAHLVFWVGHELEAFLEKPLSTLSANAKQVELLEVPGLTKHHFREGGAFEEHAHEEEHEHKNEHKHEQNTAGKKDEHGAHDHGSHEKHHDEEVDPHFWLDPENAKIIVHYVAHILSEYDPKNAALYEGNEQRLNAKLDALIGEVQNTLAPIKGKEFIVFHDAYQYFENRFDIVASGSITINPDLPPSVGRIQEIRNKIKKLGAICVFSEPQFEPKIIRTVMEGTSAKTGVLDPLGASMTDGSELYFELIRGMAHSLKDCLSSEN